jgi:methyl-accepting chemotaxis protein
MKGMAEGIKEINLNLDGLKKLTSHITENTTDIKTSISQMSTSIKELKEKSHNVQSNTISVTQAVNDIGLASTKELNQINEIHNLAANLHEELHDTAVIAGDLRKSMTQCVSLVNNKKDAKIIIEHICNLTEELHNKIALTQTHLASMQDNQILPLVLTIEERKNLSKEISNDTIELDNAIGSVVNHITEINSSSQYINSSIKNVSSDINDAYRNLGEIVNATDSMNEHGKQATSRMDEFFLKAKRVEEAHSAIEHTLIDAKDSMKSLNDLSANLRKVVDDLVRKKMV